MVKLTAPCMSIDASGTLADAITFFKWKGRNVARERVVPSNPQSGSQTGIRAMLAGLSKAWTNLTNAEKATWQDLADALKASRFNGYMQRGMQRWANWKGPCTREDDQTANGTQPTMGTCTATGGPGVATLSMAVTTISDGWLLIVHHELQGGQDRAIDNTVHVEPITANGTYTWVHRNLTPGTHHYILSSVTKDGALAIAKEEFDATVT